MHPHPREDNVNLWKGFWSWRSLCFSGRCTILVPSNGIRWVWNKLGSGPPEQRDAAHHWHLPSLRVKALSHGAQVLLSELGKVFIFGPISKCTARKGLLGSCFWKMSRDAPRFFENGSAGKNSYRQKQGKAIQDIQHSAGSFSETQPTVPSNFTSTF